VGLLRHTYADGYSALDAVRAQAALAVGQRQPRLHVGARLLLLQLHRGNFYLGHVPEVPMWHSAMLIIYLHLCAKQNHIELYFKIFFLHQVDDGLTGISSANFKDIQTFRTKNTTWGQVVHICKKILFALLSNFNVAHPSSYSKTITRLRFVKL
jgi:hypothetical protein